MSIISVNLQAVEQTIATAIQATNRPLSAVQLLAVSKTFPFEAVLEAMQAGQRAFGENYVQEGVDKIAAVAAAAPDVPLEWHFIGPIQSNKTRPIAENFAWVHAIDRLKIAQRLSGQRPAGLPPLNVCLQVNISGEDSKSGTAAAEVFSLAKVIDGLPRLSLRGLMCVPAPAATIEERRKPFAALKQLFDQLKNDYPTLDTLSMGMSADLDAAILEGATIVRIGTDIFGARR